MGHGDPFREAEASEKLALAMTYWVLNKCHFGFLDRLTGGIGNKGSKQAIDYWPGSKTIEDNKKEIAKELEGAGVRMSGDEVVKQLNQGHQLLQSGVRISSDGEAFVPVGGGGAADVPIFQPDDPKIQGATNIAQVPFDNNLDYNPIKQMAENARNNAAILKEQQEQQTKDELGLNKDDKSKAPVLQALEKLGDDIENDWKATNALAHEKGAEVTQALEGSVARALEGLGKKGMQVVQVTKENANVSWKQGGELKPNKSPKHAKEKADAKRREDQARNASPV